MMGKYGEICVRVDPECGVVKKNHRSGRAVAGREE